MSTDSALPRGLKPHRTCEEQLSLLKSRGLAIEDEDRALRLLGRLGYYRLAGYFYPLRKTRPVGEPGRLDEFMDGASFELVVQLSEFDKTLRLLALDGIEALEVAVRVAVAYHLGKIDAEAHLKPALLDTRFVKGPKSRRPGERTPYDHWLARFQKACADSKDEFVKHHREIYGGRMPLWVAIEIWDYGLLSRFFGGLQYRDRNRIAQSFGNLDGEVLASWLRMLNFVRNVAAHHSRLWNRTLPDLPRLPSIERCRQLEILHENKRLVENKLFAAFTCLRFLLKQIDPESTWHHRVGEHIASFPKTELLSIRSAGFVDGWRESSPWRP